MHKLTDKENYYSKHALIKRGRETVIRNMHGQKRKKTIKENTCINREKEGNL